MRPLGFYLLGLFLPLILVLTTSGDPPADRPIAYRGARILTAASEPIENGVLLVRKGKILAVGADADTPIPEGAEVIDLKGKTIIPGLVDTHSHIGIWPRPHVPAHNDGNDCSFLQRYVPFLIFGKQNLRERQSRTRLPACLLLASPAIRCTTIARCGATE